MHKLSAIVPVGPEATDFFQMKEWLRESTSLGIQVILVRDSFTDEKKVQFLSVFQSEIDNEEIKVLDSIGKSPGLSRNQGLSQADGEWITFWDCDDLPNPGNVLREVVNAPRLVEAIIGQFELNGIKTKTNNIFDVAFNPGNWRIAYRKEFIRDNKFTMHSWGEDQLFLIEADLLSAQCHISNLIFYNHLVGLPTQLTNKKIHAASLKDVITKSVIASKTISKSKQARIGICLMILRMSLTFFSNTSGLLKNRALVFCVKNNLRLLKLYKLDFFMAHFYFLMKLAKFK